MFQIDFDGGAFQVDLEDGHSNFAGRNKIDDSLYDLREHYCTA
jgi:hypothetical protein